MLTKKLNMKTEYYILSYKYFTATNMFIYAVIN